MPRLKHTTAMNDDSDSSFSLHDGDSANEDEESGSDTEMPDMELSDNTSDKDDDEGAEKQGVLFDGNAHPPEYYRQGIETFNEDDLDDGYASGTRAQLDSLEDDWNRYVGPVPRPRQLVPDVAPRT